MWARVDPVVVFPNVISKRVQVERLKGPGYVEIVGVVADEERTVNQVNVDLYAGECIRDGLPQRPLVQVVVMRMTREYRLIRHRSGRRRIVLRRGATTDPE